MAAPERRDSGFVPALAAIPARLSRAQVEQLLHVTAALADAVTEQEVYTALVDEVAAAMGASSVGLWMVDPSHRALQLVHGFGYSAQARQQLVSVPLDQQPSLPILDAQRGLTPVWIKSQSELFARYPHVRSYASAGRSYRVAALPLVVNQASIGVLGLTCEAAAEATEEQELLLLVARYASQSLHRMRLLSAERQSRSRADAMMQRWALLGQFSHTLAASHLDVEERVRVAATVLARSLHGCVTIALLGQDGALHLTGVHHPDPTANEWLAQLCGQSALQPGEGITGAMLASGRSMLVQQVEAAQLEDDAAPGFREFLRQYPVHSLMGACLRVGGRAIGTVTVTRTREGETFTPDDLKLLEELATRAALAIHNGQLFSEAEDARRRAEQLYVFADAVLGAERVEQVLEAALAAIEGALHADKSAVLLFDQNGVMRFRCWRHLSDDYRARVEGHSPWDRSIKDPRAILVDDACAEPSLAGFRELFVREGIGALAFVPLVSDGELLGKFMVYYDRPHHFSVQDAATAQAVAVHLAAAISRYSALEDLKLRIRNNERLAAVLAHDLRNPLAAMMTAANMMVEASEARGGHAALAGAREAARPNLGALARIMRSSGQRMRAMIDQLLDFARARSGSGLGVAPQPCNLSTLCCQALDELQLANPGRQLVRSFEGEMAGTWDPNRMLQLCSNLLANAVQHGDAREPVGLRVDGRDPARIVLEVYNEGAIPSPTMERLFEPFHRGESTQRQTAGLGLGLFIVREIVRDHGGTLRVSSVEETGTVFRVELPRHCDGSSDAG